MNPEKLEKLSLLVASLIEESNNLKNEVRCLGEIIQELEQEKQAVQEQNQSIISDLEKLNALEDSNRKMEEDHSMIRSKVQAILHNLEKMDFV
jgi:FtsZ-binding cell division protein ZapB